MTNLIKPEERLSEEHERQIARFEKIPYVPGERLRLIGIGRWMQRNYEAMMQRKKDQK